MENNMPAFLLLPPSSLHTDHPEMVDALRGNANRLSSHLDIYVTLRELLSMGSDKPLVDPGRGLDQCAFVLIQIRDVRFSW